MHVADEFLSQSPTTAFIVLSAATGGLGLVLCFVVPLLSWLSIRRKLFVLADDEEAARDNTLNWGLIQSHRTYDSTRSTVMDAHYAVRRAIRRYLRIGATITGMCGFALALALFVAYTVSFVPNGTTFEHGWWRVCVAAVASFTFSFVLTTASCVGATFQAVDAVAAMSLQVGACPTVDLRPMLVAAERIGLQASISTASAYCGVVIASSTGASCLLVWLHTQHAVTPASLVAVMTLAAVGQHVASAVFASYAVTLYHAVDDAIDISDRTGRHAMSHGLLAANVCGTAFSVPAAVATVVFDTIVAFTVSWGVDSWASVAFPAAVIAAATIIAIAVNGIVPLFNACGGDVSNSDTIPRRSHTTLWVTTALSIAATYGLSALVDNSLDMFAFSAAGACVTLLTVETAQFLARGPMVRWVCRASLSSSTSAALASVDSVTLVPALVVAMVGLGIIPTYAQTSFGLRGLAGMGLGATFPALALVACHGVGSLMTSLNTVSRMVPFTTEQQAAVDTVRPPRDQASTASTVASSTAGIVSTSVLIMAASLAASGSSGVQWAAVASGALLDSLVACVCSIATVGAQARMAPKEEYGYVMASVVPRSGSSHVQNMGTDRPPHVILEVFRNNVWWCALLAPLSVGFVVIIVVAVGFSAGLHSAVSLVAGYGIAAQTGALRAALSASTMRSLHTSGERGKLGLINDPVMSATADVIHSRKMMKQAVLATMCASTAIVVAVALAGHMPINVA